MDAENVRLARLLHLDNVPLFRHVGGRCEVLRQTQERGVVGVSVGGNARSAGVQVRRIEVEVARRSVGFLRVALLVPVLGVLVVGRELLVVAFVVVWW